MSRKNLNRTPAQIAMARIAGGLAADVLHMIGPYVKAGASTAYLDEVCNAYIVKELKVIPANIGYHGFTRTVCTSVNEVVCHGIPAADVVLRDGDIVNIDVAVIKDGWYMRLVRRHQPHVLRRRAQPVGAAPDGHHLRSDVGGDQDRSPRLDPGGYRTRDPERGDA